MEGVAKPLAGIDYPRTFTEFDKFFSEEAVCREYLSRLPSSRLLPRRVHVPVQPSYFGVTRAALLPADGVGRLHRTDVISRARRRQDPGRRRRVTHNLLGLLASSGYPPFTKNCTCASSNLNPRESFG